MGTKLGKINSELKQTVKITAEEYSLIKAVWTRIEFEPKVHGTGFYLRFFAKHPQYIKYFLTDHAKNDVNPDALMVIKFTVIMEILGYLVLDYHDKPKQFNQMVGYIGMMHKDMHLELEDTNNFCTSLIDYLREVMSDLMTDTCALVFAAFFRNVQELMMKSMAEERQRFAEEDEDYEDEDDRVVVDSPFKALLPCTWPGHSKKLIYGQPREYWILRQQEWKLKKESWRRDAQLAPVALNVQNTVETTSSDDDGLEKVEEGEKSEPEMRNSYPDDEDRGSSISSQRTEYSNSRGRASTPHFDQHDSESSDVVEFSDIEESCLINNVDENFVANVGLTPRERHRAEVAAAKSLHQQPSGRMISSTDTGSPRYSGGSTARERRRSTWN